MDGWRCSLLLEALLVVGIKLRAISSMASVLDRYGEFLCSISDTTNIQNVYHVLYIFKCYIMYYIYSNVITHVVYTIFKEIILQSY